MSINVNGGTTIAVSSSVDAPLSTAFFVQGGTTYYITGSVDYPLPAPTDRTWDEYSRRWNQANRTWNDV
jgi:hypothetical protein